MRHFRRLSPSRGSSDWLWSRGPLGPSDAGILVQTGEGFRVDSHVECVAAGSRPSGTWGFRTNSGVPSRARETSLAECLPGGGKPEPMRDPDSHPWELVRPDDIPVAAPSLQRRQGVAWQVTETLPDRGSAMQASWRTVGWLLACCNGQGAPRTSQQQRAEREVP